MDIFIRNYGRRSVLRGTGMAHGAAGVAAMPFSAAFGAAFPSENIIPTVINWDSIMGFPNAKKSESMT